MTSSTTAAGDPPRLDGVRMRVAATAEGGVVGDGVLFTFEQVGEVFSARYRGGAIVDGYLIGRIAPSGDFDFRYVQADCGGGLDAGSSTGTVDRLPDGRLRMIEDFVWSSRDGGGRNAFEQV